MKIYAVETVSTEFQNTTPRYSYFIDKNDAIKYINGKCDVYRNLRKKARINLIYEPLRGIWEFGSYCPQYYSWIEFQDGHKLIMEIKCADAN